MATGQVYLDAVLEPARSLTPRGFDGVMLFFGCASLGMGLIFYFMGAWPIVGFLGLDVLALWLAFRHSFQAQSARTYVLVTADAVDLRKVDGKGRERRFKLPAGFARVEIDTPAEAPYALRLAASGRRVTVGEFLSPEERESFARRLAQALHDARRERYRPD